MLKIILFFSKIHVIPVLSYLKKKLSSCNMATSKKSHPLKVTLVNETKNEIKKISHSEQRHKNI